MLKTNQKKPENHVIFRFFLIRLLVIYTTKSDKMHIHYHLSYEVFGTGKNVYLAFHGFGQNRKIYGAFPSVLPDSQVIAFDLFFHGSQFDHPHRALSPRRWQAMLLQFLAEHQIEKFGLIGFSMGGKIALQTVLLFPEKITDLILIAPDGVKPNFWYGTATRLPPIQFMFRKITTDKPPAFDIFVHSLHKIGLIDKTLVRMYDSQTKTQFLRDRVYYTWMLYRYFKPNLEQIAQILNYRQIIPRIFIGKHDRLMTAEHMKKITKYLKNHTLTIVPSGHHGLVQATFQVLRNERQRN